jgi:hypothetical protein
MVITMKKINRYFILLWIVSLLPVLFACEEADTLVPTTGNEVTGIRIMLPDGTNADFAVTPDDKNVINVKVFGPMNTDRTKVRMSVSLPNNATVVSPSPLGEYMDFTKPVSFEVVGADNAKKSYTVNATFTPNDVFQVSLTLPNGTVFTGQSSPNPNDTIIVEVSDNYTEQLSNIKVGAALPGSATTTTPFPATSDLTSPVSFTAKGAHGIQGDYVIKVKVVPAILEIKPLWNKTATELNFVTHNNGAVAISGDYLVVHERTKFDYYNITDGSKAGTMSFEGIDWANLTRIVPLFMANDDAGNIVATNFYMSRWMPEGGNNIIHMYWWEGVTAEPKLLFSYDVQLPGLTGNIDVGRKIYVTGDIRDHAFLYMGVSFQNIFLRWEIKNGAPVSNQPEKITFNPGYQMGQLNTIVPIEFGKNSNYFISRFENGAAKVAITYMDGTTHTPLYASEHHIQNIFHQWLGGGGSFDYLDLKGARYIFIIEQNAYNWMKQVYNVRTVISDPETTSKNPLDYLVPGTRVWNGWTPMDPNYGDNGNVTGDVVTKVADDGETAYVAFLCTNAGVTVWRVNLK